MVARTYTSRGNCNSGRWTELVLCTLLLISCLISTRVLADEQRESGASEPEAQLLSEAALEAGIVAGGEKETSAAAESHLEDESFSRRLFSAELVARVKVTGIHRIIDKALSEPGMVALLGYVYSGITQKVWKGEPANLVAFRLTFDDCDRKLKRGEYYLIFARTDMLGRLELNGCEAAVSESEAAALLAKLEQYYQG